ncbi:MAG: ABC transporter permease [Candidatus Methanomethylophilaceae archaeon]|nr:ABC transporter permease [Candidatus Methanomethylophilaceae archaeon]
MGFKYDKHNKYHRFGRSALITAISLLVLLWAWWLVSMIVQRSLDLNSSPLATPQDSFAALFDLMRNGDPLEHRSLWAWVWSSLSKFLKGFVLALVIALPVGLLMGNFKLVREFLTPWVEVVRPIAPIAWAPILVIIFQATNGSIMVVFIGIFFPLLTNIVFGVQKIDATLIDAAKTLGASDAQIFVKVLVPSTVPYLMNGIKVGLGVGWMCIVAAELYNTTLSGIGYFVKFMIDNSSYDYAFAGIIIIAVLGLLTTGVAEYISKVVSRRMGVDA